MVRIAKIIAMFSVALFLFAALSGTHPQESPLREQIITRGITDTGAVNLVTAIYLGFRAFDTLGETIVLLLAVSGVLALMGTPR